MLSWFDFVCSVASSVPLLRGKCLKKRGLGLVFPNCFIQLENIFEIDTHIYSKNDFERGLV